MKKLTFLLLAALSGLTASAQTEKGSQWIGGSISASHDKVSSRHNDPAQQISNTDQKSNVLRVGPSYNYFLADKLGLEIGAGYENIHQDSSGPEQSGETDSKNYYASLNLKKYFLYDNIVGFGIGPYATYSRGKNRSQNNDALLNYNYDSTNNYFSTGLGINFVYFPVKKVALTAGIGSLGYQYSKMNGAQRELKSNTFGFDLMSSTTFSIYYVFGK